MKNNIIQYANKFNDMDLSEFTLQQRRFLMALLYAAQNKTEKDEIVLCKQDLLNLGVYPKKVQDRLTRDMFKKELLETLDKCGSMRFFNIQKDVHGTVGLNIVPLFGEINCIFTDDLEDVTLRFHLNTWAVPYLRYVMHNFTKIPLLEYLGLRSTYSQDLYRQLKQFRMSGEWTVTKENFIQLMNIPKSYQKECNLDSRVLQPVLKELSPFFPDLSVEKIKVKKGRYSKIDRYRFTWQPDESKPWEPHKYLELPETHPLFHLTDYPTREELKAFVDEQGTDFPFTTEECVGILHKQLDQGKKIYHWKNYLLGAAKNRLKSSKKRKYRS